MPSRPTYPAQVSAMPSVTKAGARISGLLLTLVLFGCAADAAYKDGKSLVAQDKIEQALAKFQEAMASDPNNPQYKTAYLQTRDRALTNYTHDGDMLAAEGKTAEAEAMYRRALAIDSRNERAQAGLQALVAGKRHAQLFKEAQAAATRQDNIEAPLKLSSILTENPNHTQAADLNRSLAEKNAKPMPEAALAAAFKQPISIEFREAPLRQVFEVVAMSAGLNFVFDKDVKTDQKTTISLKNSTIDAAIYLLLMSNQLEQQIVNSNTIMIYPSTSAKQKDYQELVVKSFFLANADAKTVANTVKTIVKSRDIVIDEKLNMIIVRDTPEAIKLVEKLVALHDAPESEVMLEVEILEVKRSRLLDLGIQWPNSMSLTALPAITAPVLRDFRGLNSGTIGVGVGSAVISAQKLDTDTNLLANPRIRTRNHEKAKIVIGEKVPIISTTTGFAGSSPLSTEVITYVDVGLKLEVEPTIYLDGDVAIKVGLEVNNLGSEVPTKSGSVAYRIGTRTASTVLRLKDGENQVLAGLINDDDLRSANKIPGLGDLPILGRLFGRTHDTNDKTEIVLSITPHIIRNVQRPSLAASEFRSGTESGFRSVPDPTVRNPAPQPLANAPVMLAPATAMAPANQPNNATPANVVNSSGTTATPAAAADAATSQKSFFIEWMGPTQLKVGDPFDVQVVMESRLPISSLSASFNFDQRAMQLVGVEENEFLKQGGAQTIFNSQVGAGQVAIKGARLPGAATPGATTPGVVTTLHFRALAPSDGALVQLMSIAPMDAAGATLPTPPVTPHIVRIQK